ncbi:hypothetical protein IWW37_003308 [Coemansia sp. RSA 2050]|nr:hypothetical protein IWW37_003308 [Coemansia sp. RSA 2050]KAJ2733337.1 hypothetical protein IW152_003173 [Coemansia sp. BCRC 34962]
MPLVVASVQSMGYDLSRLIQACLSIVGVVVGGFYSAMGVYLVSASTPKFSYLAAPFLVIVTGALIVVASKTALNGILLDNASFMRTLASLAWIIAIAEAWVVLVTAIERPTMEDDFRFAWSRIFNKNRWQLSWLESRFGCCGFKSAADMPSSKQCADALSSGRVNGCFKPLHQHVDHLNELALEWTLVMLLVQAVVYTLGYVIYTHSNDGGVWLVDELDEGLVGHEFGQSTPAVVAAPPTSPAEDTSATGATATAAAAAAAATADSDDYVSTSSGKPREQQQQQQPYLGSERMEAAGE